MRVGGEKSCSMLSLHTSDGMLATSSSSAVAIILRVKQILGSSIICRLTLWCLKSDSSTFIAKKETFALSAEIITAVWVLLEIMAMREVTAVLVSSGVMAMRGATSPSDSLQVGLLCISDAIPVSVHRGVSLII